MRLSLAKWAAAPNLASAVTERTVSYGGLSHMACLVTRNILISAFLNVG